MLNLEEGFGGLVQQLRVGLGLDVQTMAQELQTFSGASFSRNTIGSVERGTASPRRETVETLCRYFHTKGKLTSREDVVWFCFRAGYRTEQVDLGERPIRLTLVVTRGSGFRDVVQLVLQNLGEAVPDKGGQGVDRLDLESPFVRGLQKLSEIVASLAPPAGRMRRLETKALRTLSADVWDATRGRELVTELDDAYEKADSYTDRFRYAHLLSKVEERRARYAAALQWCERAYYLASALAVGGSPLIKEPLAALCEAAGDACLNIGRPEDWERAHEFFSKAIDLRRELKRELSLQVDISEEHDTDALFQLARYRTHKKEFGEAERLYNDVLKRAAARGKHVLRAHTLKELADNYRVAGNTRLMRSSFRQALQAYSDVPRRVWKDDPALEIELYLNIAYCHRRLNDEAKAVKAFVSALELAHDRRDARRVSYACLQLARSSRVQKTPGDAAFYALVASEIMATTGAEADAEQAQAIVAEQYLKLMPEERLLVEQRARSSEYYAYASELG